MNELIPHKHERLALGAVILGGIMALIFGFAYVGKSVNDPLRLKPRTFKTADEQETEKQAVLRTKDTDHDGLVDYDELYVYRTSPYLADSDSDGYDDKKEIESGNDPSCPATQDCGRGSTATIITNPEGTNTRATQPTDIVSPLDQGFFSPPSASAGTLNLSAAQIRQLLVDSGIPKEQVDALDDQTVTDLYQQTFAQIQQGQSSPTTGSIPTIPTLTAAQLRQVLIDSGLPKEKVDAIDDKTLLDLYQQSLEQTQKQ